MDSNLFNNPAFANLSPEKLQFLLSFAQKEKPLNMKDAMPFLLSNMRQAKENHIDFTKPEIENAFLPITTKITYNINEYEKNHRCCRHGVADWFTAGRRTVEARGR